MKRIIKDKPPDFFEQWKLDYLAIHGKEPTFGNDFHGPQKQRLKETLLDEQGYICCYCMQRIGDYNSHLEHFKPQSKYPANDLDYDNILVSCDGYKLDASHCGHRKGPWYNEALIVSPLDEDVEAVFTYNADGTINASGYGGKETIKQLELNSFRLQRLRKSAIYSSGLFDRDFDIIKDQLIELYSNRQQDGKYCPFCVAVLYCIGDTSR
ncbi:MAG: retron system putative HNH endonuclease [Syntrophomonadaceae bacterium]|nr:retron system putative HNH endonuclease [Syntrophomonadaceae bacterium]